mmetsp:Transcript_30512/g.65709  ORF Transcript_30512/g.65709 Transcript_30512/m.65709 type:complete len:295 (-) Transcript_30512:44-928(-)
MRTVLGTAWILISDWRFETPEALSVSFASRVTNGELGPKNKTALTKVLLQVSKKFPSVLSSPSGHGKSGSSSSVKERQTMAGVFSSMNSPSTSAAYGCKTLARVDRTASDCQRCSSPAKSAFSGSSQATLPRQPMPRYPSSTSSASLDSLPSSPSCLNFPTHSSVSEVLKHTRNTLKPLSKTRLDTSNPRPSNSVREPKRRSKLVSEPPSPGRSRFEAGWTLSRGSVTTSPLTSCTVNTPSEKPSSWPSSAAAVASLAGALERLTSTTHPARRPATIGSVTNEAIAEETKSSYG